MCVDHDVALVQCGMHFPRLLGLGALMHGLMTRAERRRQHGQETGSQKDHLHFTCLHAWPAAVRAGGT